MNKGLDITGKKFNKLIAIRYLDNKGNQNQARWLFKCECGNERIANKFYVTHGSIKNCGCFDFRSVPKKHSEETIEKMRISKWGKNNPNYKYGKIGMVGLHSFVKRRLLKPELCDMCHKVPPYDLANKGIYDRNIENWEWLCRRCHMLSDGRMINNLNRSGKKAKIRTQEEIEIRKQYWREYNRKYSIEYEKINADKIKKRKAEYRKNNLQLLRDQSKKSYYKRKEEKRLERL